MILKYKSNNLVVRERPTTLFIREKLSNGQYMTLWFWRKRYNDPNKQIIYIWGVGLYIGSPKEARVWRRNNKGVKQTGECGLEGLRTALKWIRYFVPQLKHNEELQIGHEDMKRHRAYKYLLRYPGFVLYEFDDSSKNCIAFRKPDHWEWQPNKKGE